MPQAIGCPDRELLRRALSGLSSNEELTSIERHLLDCDSCVRHAADLSAHDAISDIMRAVVPAPTSNDQAQLNKLLPRVLAFVATGQIDTVARGDSWTPSGTAPRHPEDEQQILSCLAPPQRSDEIGRLGPYRVLKLIAIGGMGAVFQAEDEQLRRPVALKVMKPGLAARLAARERFLREARLAAALNHDNIVAIYQVGEDQGTPYLAMQLLNGETLEDRLRRQTSIPLPDLLRIGAEVAGGLAAAHAQGVIHRDIKPANIWLESGRDRVKILDFGLARAVEGELELTSAGTLLGTPAYMAPEQVRNEEVDGRSDLFSLGCVLYRISTGQLPFQGANMLAIFRALELENPKPPHAINPALPKSISDLITSLLSKNSHDRPQSADQVARQLEGLLAASASTSISDPKERHITTSDVREAAPLVAVEGQRNLARRRIISTWGASSLIFAAIVLAVVFSLRTREGLLIVSVEPSDAKVAIDGEVVTVQLPDKHGELRIEVAPGEHTLRISKDGFETKSENFVLSAGGKKMIEAKLDKSKPMNREAPVVKKGSDNPPSNGDRKPSPQNSSLARDRQIAEFLLKRGAIVDLSAGLRGQIRSVNDLPNVDFELTNVWLLNAYIDDDMKQLNGALSLACLDLFACEKITDAGIRNLTDLPRLHTLTLPGGWNLHSPDAAPPASTSDASVEHMVRVAPRLESVQLSPRCTDRSIVALSRSPRLTRLSTEGPKITDEGIAALESCERLKVLGIRNGTLSDKALTSISRIVQLETLLINGNELTDQGVKDLARSKTLSTLDISSRRLTGKSLVALQSAPKLSSLTLRKAIVNNVDLESLAKFPALTSLSLVQCTLEDGMLEVLAGLHRLTYLKISGLTQEGGDRLKKALPKCRVEAI